LFYLVSGAFVKPCSLLLLYHCLKYQLSLGFSHDQRRDCPSVDPDGSGTLIRQQAPPHVLSTLRTIRNHELPNSVQTRRKNARLNVLYKYKTEVTASNSPYLPTLSNLRKRNTRNSHYPRYAIPHHVFLVEKDFIFLAHCNRVE